VVTADVDYGGFDSPRWGLRLGTVKPFRSLIAAADRVATVSYLW